MLMLMRSEGGEAAVNCDDEMIALACQLGTDAQLTVMMRW